VKIEDLFQCGIWVFVWKEKKTGQLELNKPRNVSTPAMDLNNEDVNIETKIDIKETSFVMFYFNVF